MKKKLTTNDMQSLLYHVIRTIDRWWVEKTNLKQGYFTRSKCVIPDILYQRYVEWRFALTNDSKEYESLFISLDYENRIDYIRIALKKMKVGVYAVYDPFCEIHDGKTEVVISERTGFDPDNILHYVISKQDFDELTDKIADTVYRFTKPPYDEGEVSVNMKNGLTTKEIFVLDTSYFVIGDIYLLEIDHIYDWSKISTTPIKIPRWIYAICEDVCSTVIDFMLGGIEGRDGLLRMQVHADEIESGLITVKRVLMNNTLIQTEDEECS